MVTSAGAGLLSISFLLAIVLPVTDIGGDPSTRNCPPSVLTFCDGLAVFGFGLRILGSLFYFGAWPVAAITFQMWLHRVYRNLPALGATELSFSPRWAVGWWFVPFANFVQPVRVVIEVWQASQVTPAQSSRASRRAMGTALHIWLWWALWIGSIVLLLAPGATSNLALLAEYGMQFAAAAFAISVVRAITLFQDRSQLVSPGAVFAGGGQAS